MKVKVISMLVIIAAIATACYEENDVVTEIMTPTGKGSYPVSVNTFVDLKSGLSVNNRVYATNVNFSFELQYWSIDPVQEINVYETVGAGAKTKIFSKPYSEIAAYSKIKSADTLVIAYQTPLVPKETSVKLEVEILNQNTLSLTRLATIITKP